MKFTGDHSFFSLDYSGTYSRRYSISGVDLPAFSFVGNIELSGDILFIFSSFTFGILLNKNTHALIQDRAQTY